MSLKITRQPSRWVFFYFKLYRNMMPLSSAEPLPTSGQVARAGFAHA